MPDGCAFSIGFEIVCKEGMIKYDALYGEDEKEEFSINKNDGSQNVIRLDMKDDYEEAIKHVLVCLQENKKSEYLDISSAINGIRLKNLILKSLSERQAAVVNK